MKSLFIAALLLVGTFKSFAHDGSSVEPVVLKSFKTTFANAVEVDWSQSNDLYKAQFFLNGQHVTAYFKEDGSMQALARHISTNALPVLLQTSLQNSYKNQWVSDVLEVTNDGNVQYYATVENAHSKVILKATASAWSTFQKQRKD